MCDIETTVDWRMILRCRRPGRFESAQVILVGWVCGRLRPSGLDRCWCVNQDERIENAATPALLHPDFHKRNIYVSAEEPIVIIGLIDWQSASIEPAFIYGNETPDFAELPRCPKRTHARTNEANSGLLDKRNETGKMLRSAIRHMMCAWKVLLLSCVPQDCLTQLYFYSSNIVT
jgi:hypothetical protein